MKRGKEHIIPLSDAAMAVLSCLNERRISKWVFPSAKPSVHISTGAMAALLKRMKRTDITPHGFRSTFRDWAGDTTNFTRDVIEFSLSHIVGEEAERAYRRGTALEKRTRLMQAWSDYATGEQTSNVIPMINA